MKKIFFHFYFQKKILPEFEVETRGADEGIEPLALLISELVSISSSTKQYLILVSDISELVCLSSSTKQYLILVFNISELVSSSSSTKQYLILVSDILELDYSSSSTITILNLSFRYIRASLFIYYITIISDTFLKLYCHGQDP